MTHKLRPTAENRERGAALLLALLVMTVLAGLGFALMASSSTESLIHGNFRRTIQAFYTARGGLEEARGRLWKGAEAAIRIVAPPNVTSGTYILLGNTIDPTNPSCTYRGVACADPDAPASVTFASTAQTGAQVPYAWVKITRATQRKLERNLLDPSATATNDTTQVSWNGEHVYLDAAASGNPLFIFTVLAIQPGKATRTIRELASFGQFPELPAALTLNGPNPTFQGGTSSNFGISGMDQGVAGHHGAAIGVIQNSDIAPVQAGAPRPENYPGVGNSSPPPADVQNVSSDLDQLYQTCGGVSDLVDQITEIADHVYNSNMTALPYPGSAGNPVINVVNGDLNMGITTSPLSGAGVLLVTGNLILGGNPSYDGIVYVIGNGYMEESGGGTGVFQGGIFVANTTTCPGGLGSPSFRINGAGNSGIRFNSDFTQQLRGQLPLELLSLNY